MSLLVFGKAITFLFLLLGLQKAHWRSLASFVCSSWPVFYALVCRQPLGAGESQSRVFVAPERLLASDGLSSSSLCMEKVADGPAHESSSLLRALFPSSLPTTHGSREQLLE